MALNRFTIDLKMTDNNKSFNFDIPYNINLAKGRFILSGVAGKMGANNTFVQVECPQLSSQYIWNSFDNGKNIIGSTVLQSTASKPKDRTVLSNEIGYPIPMGITNLSNNLNIILLNESGTAIADGDIDWVILTLTFWST